MNEITFSYRSENIDQLITALAKAQGAYKDIIPNEDAPGGKFANRQAILKATRESCSLNALSVNHHIELLDAGDGAAVLKTMLAHGSGQYMCSMARVLSGKTDRATGNSYEYHMRMHLHMLLGTAPTKYDPILFDDNGLEQLDNFTVDELKKPESKREPNRSEVITKHQYDDLQIELEGYAPIAKQILDRYQIETLADMPKSEYFGALHQIRRIKKLEEEYDAKKR